MTKLAELKAWLKKNQSEYADYTVDELMRHATLCGFDKETIEAYIFQKYGVKK